MRPRVSMPTLGLDNVLFAGVSNVLFDGMFAGEVINPRAIKIRIVVAELQEMYSFEELLTAKVKAAK